LNIAQIHKGDIIRFAYLKGYVVDIDKKEKSLKVRVDALGETPFKIDISMVEEIISHKVIYGVNLYYYEKDIVKTYDFETLKEAKEFIAKNTNKGEDDYTLSKRDRDTHEILEDIII